MMAIRIVSQAMWCELPLRVRLAAGAALAEKVSLLYSIPFREAFLQNSTLELVFQIVEGKRVSETILRQAYDEGESVCEKAESEGYHFYEICTPFSLLEEVFNGDGKGICCAMSGVEIAYSNQILYCHHIAPSDHRLHKLTMEIDSLQEIVYPIILRVYTAARDIAEEHVSRESFSWVEFPDPRDLSLLPESLQKIAKKPSKPELIPVYERYK